MNWRPFLLLPALAGAPGLAQTEGEDALAWRCWYDQRAHLTCVLRSAPARLDSLALPGNLPAVVKQLRNDPAGFRGRFVHVPLLSHAPDLRFAAVLARAAVCGSRRACSVSFEPVPPAAAELRAIEARLLERETEVALFGSETDLESAAD